MNAAAKSQSAQSPPAPPAPATRRVMLVEDQMFVSAAHRADLEKLGHEVVAEASTAQQAIELFDRHSPDLVLMDVRLGDDDGVELSKILLEKRSCPIVIVSAYSDEALLARAAAAGVFGYLVKPVLRESLAAQIAIAVRRFNDAQLLRDEKESLAQSLESRKLVERAKGIFMKRLNLDEPAAHKKLQAESQKRRLSIIELAKKIIESEKLFD